VPSAQSPDTYQGHRRRLRDRYRTGGIAALHDYEVLELLLTFVFARKDTKPIAKALVSRFKTVSGVLAADEAALGEIPQMGGGAALFLRFVRDLSAYCLRERFEHQPLVTHRRDVEEYLRFHFGRRTDEFVAVLFLDNGNHIVGMEVVAEGTVNQCAIYPRTIVGHALKKAAASMILVHNHPGGSVQASEADWQITQRLFEIGDLLDIPLVDHIIISKSMLVSLRDLPRWPKRRAKKRSG
jgi:DNA repair protein RadC